MLKKHDQYGDHDRDVHDGDYNCEDTLKLIDLLSFISLEILIVHYRANKLTYASYAQQPKRDKLDLDEDLTSYDALRFQKLRVLYKSTESKAYHCRHSTICECESVDQKEKPLFYNQDYQARDQNKNRKNVCSTDDAMFPGLLFLALLGGGAECQF